MKQIKVLGSGCAKCNKLYAMTETAAQEMQLEYELQKVEDINEIVGYGVMLTPALVVDGEVALSGKLPTQEQLKELIK